MILTLQHSPPPAKGIPCGHCDDPIIIGEDFKYVKFLLGTSKMNFHEACFLVLLRALNQFDQVFLKDRQGERGMKVH